MTEDEKQELKETASSWKANAKLFTKMSEECNKHLKYGNNSIAITFEQNAKILEALAK